MPDFSANQGIELPNATDNANGPLAFDNYNDDVENRLVQRFPSVADRTARNPTPVQGEFSYITSLDEFQRFNIAWKSVRASDKTVRCVLRRTTDQGVATGAIATAISWQTADLNDYVTPMWDAGTPTLILLPEPGLYWVQTNLTFQANATGTRSVIIDSTAPSSSVAFTRQNFGAGTITRVPSSTMVYTTTTTDTVTINAAQDSGVTLQILASGNPRVVVARVG